LSGFFEDSVFFKKGTRFCAPTNSRRKISTPAESREADSAVINIKCWRTPTRVSASEDSTFQKGHKILCPYGFLLGCLSLFINFQKRKVSFPIPHFSFASPIFRIISYIATPPATETLRDSFLPRMGIEKMRSHFFRISGEIPSTSCPTTSAIS